MSGSQQPEESPRQPADEDLQPRDEQAADLQGGAPARRKEPLRRTVSRA